MLDFGGETDSACIEEVIATDVSRIIESYLRTSRGKFCLDEVVYTETAVAK